MERAKTEKTVVEIADTLARVNVGETIVIGRRLWADAGHRVRAALAAAKVAVWTTGSDSATVQVTRVL